MIKKLKQIKKSRLLLGISGFLIFGQALYISKLISEKDDRNYQVNLVRINTEKDSIDYLKMKNDLKQIDLTVQQLNGFLAGKNIASERLLSLSQDSLSNSIYLSKASNRYSQYLVDLEKKLQQVPLGIPTSGYISSNFGVRKNPIPTPNPNILLAASGKLKKSGNTSGDSLTAQSNHPLAEKDQMQFHKGVDIAVAYGTDVQCAAAGTVIFSGQKGGYGNCVIVSHGNGLATLYGHLSQLLVRANDRVKVGQIIAKSGNSGRSTGPHLHYEVHKNNQPVNPKLFLNL
ncbi:M23 family metallopeptidase [Daejeonia sp. YH14]|uniref:M23 family metallopeptidase n=1 Tax=Daejeonia sp. YH14 TaxID=3439042 RepID=UPI003F49998F